MFYFRCNHGINETLQSFCHSVLGHIGSLSSSTVYRIFGDMVNTLWKSSLNDIINGVFLCHAQMFSNVLSPHYGCSTRNSSEKLKLVHGAHGGHNCRPICSSSASLGVHWTELNQNLPHVRKWGGILKMHVQNLGYPSPNIGPQTTHFWRFSTTSQLNGKCSGEDHQDKTRYRQSRTVLETTKRLLFHPKISWTLGYKHRKIEPWFLITVRNICILLHCQVSYTEVSERNSSKLYQTVG